MSGLCCDTSVLVAATLTYHPRHAEVYDVVVERIDAVPAHALLETYSVLTRLPSPQRLDASSAAELLGLMELVVDGMPATGQRRLVQQLAATGIAGGAVYDGLVAATARHHGRTLVTLDRRARTVYDAVGVTYELL